MSLATPSITNTSASLMGKVAAVVAARTTAPDLDLAPANRAAMAMRHSSASKWKTTISASRSAYAMQLTIQIDRHTGSSAAERFVSEGQFRESDRKSTRLNSSHLVISYAVF